MVSEAELKPSMDEEVVRGEGSMGNENEGTEFEPTLDFVCDKIISHLEGIKQKRIKNQQGRAQFDALIPSLGGGVARHYDSEFKLIDEIINGVRQKDPKYLSRFISRFIKSMPGLDLTEAELGLISGYCSSVSERAVDNRSNSQPVAGPQTKLRKDPPSVSFTDIIQSFPESEQADALYYAQIRARQEKLKPASLALYNLLNTYFFSLNSQGQEELRATNIFHLFYGSGKDRARWLKSRLLTRDEKFQQFIDGEFVPKLEELEEEQNARQSKTA